MHGARCTAIQRWLPATRHERSSDESTPVSTSKSEQSPKVPPKPLIDDHQNIESNVAEVI